MSIREWLDRQGDREANGDNVFTRQIFPRERYRNGWNLEFQGAFTLSYWGLGVDVRKSDGGFTAGVGVGPLWVGLSGFTVAVIPIIK